jgi:hypothetical protein
MSLTMIRIAVAAAYEAITATLSLDSVATRRGARTKGGYLIWPAKRALSHSRRWAVISQAADPTY